MRMISRRSWLTAASAAWQGAVLRADAWTEKLRAFLGSPAGRPDLAWQNYEDLIYHDDNYPSEALNTATEFYAFLNRPQVFNRAMRWEERNGAVLCWSEGGDLLLTGDRQASAWHSDPANALEQNGALTRFVKRARQLDCAVLPGFQFHLGQHPEIEVAVGSAAGDWQFVVAMKGRCGKPLFSSGWKTGPGRVFFHVAEEFRRRGYRKNYAELHFALGVWTSDPQAAAAVDFEVRLRARPAVVTCLPVVRISGKQPSIAAVVLNGKGERLGRKSVRVSGAWTGGSVEFRETERIWTAALPGIPIGDHELTIAAEGAVTAAGTAQIRITNGQFFSYDQKRQLVTQGGKAVGPLSGSYQASFYFRDAGLPSEKLVQGQKEWDAWDRGRSGGEHMHYWEALTEAELDRRFRYLRQQGWDLLHLCQHWGVWERLDAGGRIAPHGAEQLALYLRVAARHGLAAIQALTHYPYCIPTPGGKTNGTMPYHRYIEAGFRNEHWFRPGSRFDELFHAYLKDFTTLFGDETALFAMTASGEGDWLNGLDRSRDVFRVVRSHDRNHLFLAEPVHRMRKLPEELCRGWDQDMLAGRTYWIGEAVHPEFDLGIEFKFMQLGRLFMGEGCWPAPPRYTKFHHQVLHSDRGCPESWTGTRRYRTRIRDTFYLGLVHRIPILLTWDEQIAEDEHAILRQVRERIDWTQKFLEPEIALHVDATNLMGPGRVNLGKYEEFFAAAPASCRLVLAPSDQAGAAHLIDARQPFRPPSLPDRLREGLPLALSSGYCASYLWSADRKTLLAYVYNTTGHTEARQWLAGVFHRMPKPAAARVTVRNLPRTSLRCTVYDLETKTVCHEDLVRESMTFHGGVTDHDYLLLIAPAGPGAAVHGQRGHMPISAGLRPGGQTQ
jgi:hypothetical protein